MHFSSSHIKNVNVLHGEPEKGLLNVQEHLSAAVIREMAGTLMVLTAPEKKVSHRDKTHSGRFKGWRMPEQSEGYIKAKKHGLL